MVLGIRGGDVSLVAIEYRQRHADLRKANVLIDGLLLTGGLQAPPDFEAGGGLRGQALDGQ